MGDGILWWQAATHISASAICSQVAAIVLYGTFARLQIWHRELAQHKWCGIKYENINNVLIN